VELPPELSPLDELPAVPLPLEGLELEVSVLELVLLLAPALVLDVLDVLPLLAVPDPLVPPKLLELERPLPVEPSEPEVVFDAPVLVLTVVIVGVEFPPNVPSVPPMV